MKRWVNGVEVELPEAAEVEVVPLADRLLVRESGQTHSALVVRSGEDVLVSYQGRQFRVEPALASRRAHGATHTGEIRATMPGAITFVGFAAGDPVAKGDKIVVLEAMKTQQAFLAPFDGTVSLVNVEAGTQVGEGDVLATIEPA